MTSQYGDVYLRAIASRARRSSLESLIAYGLLLGIGAYIPRMPGYQAASWIRQKTYVVVFAEHTSSYSTNIRHRIYNECYAARFQSLHLWSLRPGEALAAQRQGAPGELH